MDYSFTKSTLVWATQRARELGMVRPLQEKLLKFVEQSPVENLEYMLMGLEQDAQRLGKESAQDTFQSCDRVALAKEAEGVAFALRAFAASVVFRRVSGALFGLPPQE